MLRFEFRVSSMRISKILACLLTRRYPDIGSGGRGCTTVDWIQKKHILTRAQIGEGKHYEETEQRALLLSLCRPSVCL